MDGRGTARPSQETTVDSPQRLTVQDHQPQLSQGRSLTRSSLGRIHPEHHQLVPLEISGNAVALRRSEVRRPPEMEERLRMDEAASSTEPLGLS